MINKNKEKKNDNLLNKKSSVFIATFAHYENGQRMSNNGMVEPMLSFFVPKVRRVDMVIQPHPGSDRISPEVELYENGALKKKFNIHPFFYLPVYLLCLFPNKRKIRFSYKMRDLLLVLIIAISQKKQYDFFIGLEVINLFAGLILKKLHVVKSTIYYVSDYSPRRFKNKWFNAFYVRLDRFALGHADYTWDVSSAMQKGRIEAGLSTEKSYRVVHVPNGLFLSQIASLPIAQRNKYDLIYMGILEPDMGPDLAIGALKEVIKRNPRARLHIIGGPKKDLDRMIALSKKLKLGKAVIFYGFVPDNTKMAKIVRSCYIGLAPYRAFPYSKRWYGDAGKIRQYMASGLPVVTTHVPPLGRYVVERGAGILTKDTVKDFAEGIQKLLSDRKLYEKLAYVARKLGEENTWENSYKKAFMDMAILDER